MVELRHIVWSIMFTLAFLGVILADSKVKASIILRVTAYLTPLTLIIVYILGLTKPVDWIQIPFILLGVLASIAISVHSENYHRVLIGFLRPIQLPLDSVLVLIIAFFIARSLIELAILWIFVELICLFLISFSGTIEARRAAFTFLVVCAATGDISLFTWIALTALQIGIDRALLNDFTLLATSGITANTPLLTFLLIIGFLTKMAMVPLHFWLPDAYTEAPSPVSAMLSGLASKMGLYGLLRVYSTVKLDVSTLMYIAVLMGFITAVYGSIMASGQVDVKRVLAYSSISHYGVMVILFGLIPIQSTAMSVLLAYAIFHGIAKTCLFLNSGSIEIIASTRNIYSLGYLARVDSKLFRYALLSALSLIGIPPTLGFVVKALAFYTVISSIAQGHILSFIALVGLTVSSVFSLLYSMKYIGAYIGSYRVRPIQPLPIPLNAMRLSESLLALSLLVFPVAAITLISTLTIPLLVVYTTSITVFSMFILRSKVKVVREEELWFGGLRS